MIGRFASPVVLQGEEVSGDVFEHQPLQTAQIEQVEPQCLLEGGDEGFGWIGLLDLQESAQCVSHSERRVSLARHRSSTAARAQGRSPPGARLERAGNHR